MPANIPNIVYIVYLLTREKIETLSHFYCHRPQNQTPLKFRL